VEQTCIVLHTEAPFPLKTDTWMQNPEKKKKKCTQVGILLLPLNFRTACCLQCQAGTDICHFLTTLLLHWTLNIPVFIKLWKTISLLRV